MTVTATWTHRHACTLPASPSRVFAALTTPQDLRRWFAQDVAVDVRHDGPFTFWGRHTYGTPAAADPRQRITRVERDRVLAFRWPFEGLDSEVLITLSPDNGSDTVGKTTLALEHRFEAMPQGTYTKELVDDLWRLTLGNLDAHLRGGDGIVLPDYSDPSPEIRLSIVIDAPPDRVFRALIDPAALNTWIASSAVVDPRVGGRYSYGWKYQHGGHDVAGGPTEIVDLVPNERLVIDWPDWRGDPTKPRTRVAWLLEPVGSKTRVTVVHGEFPRAVDISDYPFGWSSFLTRLKSLVEGSAS
jgi:uncharacterized protein YndB with AHSA1/START domain